MIPTLGRRRVRKYDKLVNEIIDHFDMEALKARCSASIGECFAELNGEMRGIMGAYHCIKDNDSGVLAVAHLDTVQNARTFGALQLVDETLIYSPQLDDRLGVYTILDMLPHFDINMDILFTENEEVGQSTASDFRTEKNYNWLVEFDRRGENTVSYCYDWPGGTLDILFDMQHGSYSDICYMEHIGCKGFNVGVGYNNEHSTRANFVVEEYIRQIARFILFYQSYCKRHFGHVPEPPRPLALYHGCSRTPSKVNAMKPWDDSNEEIEVGDAPYYCVSCQEDRQASQVYAGAVAPWCRKCYHEVWDMRELDEYPYGCQSCGPLLESEVYNNICIRCGADDVEAINEPLVKAESD